MTQRSALAAVLAVALTCGCSWFHVSARPQRDPVDGKYRCEPARRHAVTDLALGAAWFAGGIGGVIYHEHCDGCSDRWLVTFGPGVVMAVVHWSAALSGVLRARTCRARLDRLARDQGR